MAIGTSTGLGSAPADGASLLPVPDAAGRRMRLQLPRSPKVLIGLAMLAVFLIVAVIGPWIAPYNPSRSFSATASFPQAPSAAHWLGTTQQQQDVLSQLLAGGRSTVLVAFVAGLVATVLSIVIGVTAGYAGRLTDDLLSMLANFFLVLPALPLLIVIFGFLKTAQGGHDLLIGLVIAITGWAWGARVLRAQTLSLRNRDYVESARIVGERGWRIIGFEILPNLTPIVASSFLFTVLYGVINFGIDEFINPRLRVAGLSRRRARRAGVSGLPKRFVLGVTPVVRQDLAAAADGTPGWGPGGRAPGGRAPGGRAPGGRAPGGPAPGAGSADLISASGHAKSRRWRRGGGQ